MWSVSANAEAKCFLLVVVSRWLWKSCFWQLCDSLVFLSFLPSELSSYEIVLLLNIKSISGKGPTISPLLCTHLSCLTLSFDTTASAALQLSWAAGDGCPNLRLTTPFPHELPCKSFLPCSVGWPSLLPAISVFSLFPIIKFKILSSHQGRT